MGRWLLRIGVIALTLTACTTLWWGCGPITSTATIHEANLAIETARMEQAERYAVYEFVSAVEYLDKAREEWAQSDFQHAEEYSQRALDLANAARERAMADPRQDSREVDEFDDLDE